MKDKCVNTPFPVYDTLKKVFGFQSFRPNQEEIIRSILERKDVFAAMPTGGAKLEHYGNDFTMAIKKYLDENPGISALAARSSAPASK